VVFVVVSVVASVVVVVVVDAARSLWEHDSHIQLQVMDGRPRETEALGQSLVFGKVIRGKWSMASDPRRIVYDEQSVVNGL
jgi:hypothetical protein